MIYIYPLPNSRENSLKPIAGIDRIFQHISTFNNSLKQRRLITRVVFRSIRIRKDETNSLATRSVARITATDSFSSRIDRCLVNASTTTELITTATGHVTRGSGACENLLAIFSVLRQLSLWCNRTKVDRVCRSRLNGNLQIGRRLIVCIYIPPHRVIIGVRGLRVERYSGNHGFDFRLSFIHQTAFLFLFPVREGN